MPKPARDRELAAIDAILEALDGLDGEAIQRVLDYVFARLSLSRASRVSLMSHIAPGQSSEPPVGASSLSGDRKVSIRDLKEEKRPKSSNQMAAIVAYYLTETEGSQDSINAEDIRKYFKQAGFKLPRAIAQTLPNAAAAGYFDSIGEGRYRLNPVGYNLVVHGLPQGKETAASTRSRKKQTKKRSTKQTKKG